ncbi:MAG: hypothetical protein ACFB2W_00650 [Leptolyngbyaceae cyanobacterium]
MAAQRKLQLIIEIVTKQQQKIAELISQLEDLNKAARQSGKVGGDTKQIDQLVGKLREAEGQLKGLPQQSRRFTDELAKGGKLSAQSVTAIATSFLAVQSALQGAFTLAQTFYAKTIGLSEQLNAQLLKNAANIAATSRIEIGGNLVEGVEAVKALQPELRAALQELEIRTEGIAGVTDQQVRTAFDAVIGKVGLLNGQSQKFNNSIESSTELAAKLTAALSANNLSDTTQIYQEIGDLLTGDITADSQLARALAIDRETIQRWQQQGVLVDELINRLGDFEDAANLAANSISNVSSNFISLTERIAREGTADLLDPIASGLVEIFDLVSENEDTIVAEIKIVLDAVSGIAMQIGSILAPLGALGDEADYVLGLLLDGFQGVERLLEIFGPQLEAVLAGAIGKIEFVIGAAQKLGVAFNFIFGGIRNVNEAIEAYGNASKIAAAGSQQLIDSIGNAGNKSEATQKLLRQQAEAQIASNNAQIESLRELVPATGAQREAIQGQISTLEGWNEKLVESKDTLQGVGNELKVLPREIANVADTFEEVATRTDNALRQLANGSQGSLEKVQQNIQQLTQGINQLFDAGELSDAAAIARLNRAIEAPGLELQQKLALAAEVRKIQKTASDEKIAAIETELSAVESGLSAEEKATADAIGRTSALRQQALEARLEQTRDAITTERSLLEQDSGSQRTLNQLLNQEKQLTAQREALSRDSARQIREAQVKERKAAIDSEIALVQAAIDEEGRATAENVMRLNELRQEGLEEQIKAQRSLVEELTSSNASEAAINQAKAQAKTLQAELKALAVTGQREIEDARIEEINRAEIDIKDLATKSRRTIFLEEQALLQERARNAELSEEQVQARISQLRAEANRDRLAQEVQLQEQRVSVFVEGSRRRRQAEIELADLRTQLSEANAGVELANRQAAVAAIDAQIQGEQRLQDLQQSRLDLREQAESRIIGSLQQQRDLFESQLNLINQRNQLSQSLAGAETEDAERALAIRQELDNNENLSRAQRKQLEKELKDLGFSRSANEKKIAKEILDRKKEEIQLRAQALETEQSAQRAQLQFQNQLREIEAARETRKEQSRLRELQFQQTLLKLEAEKAMARGDAQGAEIAQQGVAQTDNAIQEQQAAIAQSQTAERITAQINQDATQALAAQQARESFEFARGVAQEAQALATELGGINEQVGRRARRFASQQSDIEDEARVEAERTLAGLQGVRAENAVKELQAAQQRTQSDLELLATSTEVSQVLEGQLTLERQLADEAERRLTATQRLSNTLGNSAQPLNIPSLDTGGSLPSGHTSMIHSGELLVPGAPTKSAAVNAIATGRTVQAVQSDGLYRGPGGYVLNRGDVQQLIAQPSVSLVGQPTVTNNIMSGGSGQVVDIQELNQQTGLLGELVTLAQDTQAREKAAARLARHQRARG